MLTPTPLFGPPPALAAVPATNWDAIGLAWLILTNPLTGYVLGALVSLVLYMVLKDARARAIAQNAADYIEFIERQAVIAAELAGWVKGIKGYDKLLFALNYVEARLAEHGIVGNAERVDADRVIEDLKELKEELFPGKGTSMDALESMMRYVPPSP